MTICIILSLSAVHKQIKGKEIYEKSFSGASSCAMPTGM